MTSLAGLPHAQREARAQALATEEALKPFDLSRLPLLRARVLVLGEEEHILIVNLHHIVADGLSVALLVSELDACYRSRTVGTPCALPVLKAQYPDYAAWQRRAHANGDACAMELEYWRARLGDTLPDLELPADHPRPAAQSFTGSNAFFDIPPALANGLRALAAREGCTAFMT